MNCNRSLLMYCLFIIFSSATTNAQYSNHSVTLRSDFPSKSVLVSNLFAADRVGDVSPIIGAASWIESGRQVQCRSLLEFNYKPLPSTLIDDPSLIISAELVLYPVQTAFSQNDIDKPAKIIVRRVLNNWEDSTTLWLNQPAVDSSWQVIEIIKKKHKKNPVIVDVTSLLLDMLRFGNKGFMISNDNSPEPSMALSQWFASSKYDNKNMRPILVINFRQLDPVRLEPSHKEFRERKTAPQGPVQNTSTPVRSNRVSE